ncbi:TRAP transporter TatT component family protein [Teredinibacter sp. KSP-S5-2]|uniref:TRAP transporter TatT component family protein n=1 Tax=Teredinibacter sp. KSP-S5-2 TaxID=3034506 RepID=UPI00293490B6|nr:TRAP transporter TatT component family protein [Teredinibacter sp. KSP-S5-2]WNO09648.1 TRAP transporter TatT component family protein [Teredinibacter sp. KSP-S5-2]
MNIFRLSLLICCVSLSSGCSVLSLPDSISRGILNNDDLQMVGEGLPTYLLIVDGLLENYPDDKSILVTASALNGAYAGVFVDDLERKQKLTDKSLGLAQNALCVHNKKACNIRKMPFETYKSLLASMDRKKDLAPLYSLGSAWAAYIQLNSSDWNAIAELTKVQALMQHIVTLNPEFENGMPWLYLGVLNSLLPQSLGGKPEVAKQHFEKAITVSDGKNLIIKVYFAQQYARLTFDQQLHDQLLQDVLAADPHQELLTLQNVYAQSLAKTLLEESQEYFE